MLSLRDPRPLDPKLHHWHLAGLFPPTAEAAALCQGLLLSTSRVLRRRCLREYRLSADVLVAALHSDDCRGQVEQRWATGEEVAGGPPARYYARSTRGLTVGFLGYGHVGSAAQGRMRRARPLTR
jgi:hypothetical protein